MSIKLVVTRGFSNGTFLGAIKEVVTRGYTISDFVPSTWTAKVPVVTNWTDKTPAA